MTVGDESADVDDSQDSDSDSDSDGAEAGEDNAATQKVGAGCLWARGGGCPGGVYSGSPTIGWPNNCKCKRIWCILPVVGSPAPPNQPTNHQIHQYYYSATATSPTAAALIHCSNVELASCDRYVNLVVAAFPAASTLVSRSVTRIGASTVVSLHTTQPNNISNDARTGDADDSEANLLEQVAVAASKIGLAQQSILELRL
jgi:hypothetical protein